MSKFLKWVGSMAVGVLLAYTLLQTCASRNDSTEAAVDSLQEEINTLSRNRDSLIDEVKELEESKENLDSALVVVYNQHQKETERLEERAEQSNKNFNLAADSLMEAVPRPIIPLVNKMKEEHRREIAFKDSIIAAKDSVIRTQEKALAVRDSLLDLRLEINESLQAALKRVRRQRDLYEAKANPGFLVRVKRNLEIVGITAGVTAGTILVLTSR